MKYSKKNMKSALIWGGSILIVIIILYIINRFLAHEHFQIGNPFKIDNTPIKIDIPKEKYEYTNDQTKQISFVEQCPSDKPDIIQKFGSSAKMCSKLDCTIKNDKNKYKYKDEKTKLSKCVEKCPNDKPLLSNGTCYSCPSHAQWFPDQNRCILKNTCKDSYLHRDNKTRRDYCVQNCPVDQPILFNGVCNPPPICKEGTSWNQIEEKCLTSDENQLVNEVQQSEDLCNSKGTGNRVWAKSEDGTTTKCCPDTKPLLNPLTKRCMACTDKDPRLHIWNHQLQGCVGCQYAMSGLTEAIWDPINQQCRAGCAGLRTQNIQKGDIMTQYCIGPPKDIGEAGRWNAQKGVWELCDNSKNEFKDNLSGECVPCDALYLAYNTGTPLFNGNACVACPPDKPKWNQVSRRCSRYGYKKGTTNQPCDDDNDCINQCSNPVKYIKRNGEMGTKRTCLGRGAVKV